MRKLCRRRERRPRLTSGLRSAGLDSKKRRGPHRVRCDTVRLPELSVVPEDYPIRRAQYGFAAET